MTYKQAWNRFLLNFKREEIALVLCTINKHGKK